MFIKIECRFSTQNQLARVDCTVSPYILPVQCKKSYHLINLEFLTILGNCIFTCA